MRESTKAVCVLAMIVAVVVAVFVWTDDRPSTTVWLCRWGTIVVFLAALAMYWRVHLKPLRRDKIPDQLKQRFGNYYNCGGFCFAFVPCLDQYEPHLRMWFQNQHERPCRATVYLAPIRHFWAKRPQVEKIEVPLTCDGGECYSIAVPIATSAEMAGKKVICNVSADVEYPEKRGKRLMFHEGMQVSAGSLPLLMFLAPLAGVFVWFTPARVTLQMPNVIDSLPSGVEHPATDLHWTAGD